MKSSINENEEEQKCPCSYLILILEASLEVPYVVVGSKAA
jgi:hypothetical protein